MVYQAPCLHPVQCRRDHRDPEHLGHAEVLPHRIVLVDPPQAYTLRSKTPLPWGLGVEHKIVIKSDGYGIV